MAKAEGETQTGKLIEKAGVGRRAGGQAGRWAELQLYMSSSRCSWNFQHNRCSAWGHLILVFA